MDKKVRAIQGTDLNEKNDLKPVSPLIYAMGDEAEDILDSFRLSDDERKSYAAVRGKFESYLMKKRNTDFDRISFFQGRQEE